MTRPDDDAPTPGGDARAVGNLLVLAAEVTGVPCRQLRWAPGPRGHPPWVRALGLAVVPPVWMGFGGGDPAVFRAVFLALVIVTLVQPLAFRRIRRGGLYHTRGIGVSLAELALGCGEAAGKLVWEPLTFAAVAAGFAAAGEPGLAGYFLVAGSACGVIEWVLVARRAETLRRDAEDARWEAERQARAFRDD